MVVRGVCKFFVGEMFVPQGGCEWTRFLQLGVGSEFGWHRGAGLCGEEGWGCS